MEQAVLRTSLVPGLLKNAVINANRQQATVKLFELGRTFCQNSDGRHELRRAGLALAGLAQAPHWRDKARPMDFYDLKGIVEGLLQALHLPSFQWTRFPMKAFHPKKSCVVLSGTRVLGWVGEVHPDLLQALGLSSPVLAAEIDVSATFASTPTQLTYQPSSAFPPVHRDLSFVVDVSTPYERVEKALRTSAGALLETVSPIDVFANEKIGAGKKSMTVSLLFRHQERTLTDAEVETVMKKLVADLERKCEAVLRQ
jgi:phenylalanyl-tRNA synthetase beta chain